MIPYVVDDEILGNHILQTMMKSLSEDPVVILVSGEVQTPVSCSLKEPEPGSVNHSLDHG